MRGTGLGGAWISVFGGLRFSLKGVALERRGCMAALSAGMTFWSEHGGGCICASLSFFEGARDCKAWGSVSGTDLVGVWARTEESLLANCCASGSYVYDIVLGVS